MKIFLRMILIIVFLLVISCNEIKSEGINNEEKSDNINTIENGEYYSKINGINLWYKISGNGPICIFPSPGWGPSSDLYFKTLKELEKFYQVVYVDTRGSGRSDKPQTKYDYRYEDFNQDINELRKYLNKDKIYLIGHSRGGWLVMNYTINYPDNVNGLILIDSSVAHDDSWEKDMSSIRMEKMNQSWYQENYQDIDISLLSMLFAFKNIENYEKIKNIGTMSRIALEGINVSNETGVYLLPMEDISCPTLVIVGEDDDRASPNQALRITNKISNSKLLVIKNAGHFPWIEQKDEFWKSLSNEFYNENWRKR